MMRSDMRHIHKLGLLMGDMVLSAFGCFAFMRGLRLGASGQETLDARSFVRSDGRFTSHRRYRRGTLPFSLRRE